MDTFFIEVLHGAEWKGMHEIGKGLQRYYCNNIQPIRLQRAEFLDSAKLADAEVSTVSHLCLQGLRF